MKVNNAICHNPCCSTGPGNVKKESFGTEEREKDAVKNVDKNSASENSKLKKGIKFISEFLTNNHLICYILKCKQEAQKIKQRFITRVLLPFLVSLTVYFLRIH